MGAFTLSGCLSGGASPAGDGLKSAPGVTRYLESPAVYVIGEAATPNLLVSSSGDPVRVTINPALPTGLSLDPVTGTISGTPTVLSAPTRYEIAAVNSYGTSFVHLLLSVGDPAPVIALSASSVSGVVGTPITPLVATNTGGDIATCTTTPALPAGLSIASLAASCTISGTPTDPFASGEVTLTASSTGRSTDTTFTLSVIDITPAFSFAAPVAFPRGVAGTVAAPVSTGGTITSCSSLPALPAGLTLRADCAVTGSPASTAALAAYVLTGTNSGGSSTATLNLSVVDVTPDFHYAVAGASLALVKGTAMTTIAPVVASGVITSCSVLPALPAGLSLSAVCAISGTPSAVQAETSHVVSATNSAGTGTSTLKITVTDQQPRFSYASALLTVDNRDTANFPAIHNAGTATGCSASPALPAGLSIAADCDITGSPTSASEVAEYTITATNSGGSYAQIIEIEIPEVAPSISYTPDSVTARRTNLLSGVDVDNAGGAITSCSVSPDLPAGLLIDDDCRISGIPSELSSPGAAYLVTASNSVGSSSTTITIEVVDIVPSIVFVPSSVSLTKGTAATITSLNLGGDATACSTSPALPAGLSVGVVLDPDSSAGNCRISGTPSAITAQANYTITATNTGGSATAVITLTVVDVPPGIVYSPAERVLTTGTAYAFGSGNSGGNPTFCYSTPPLPMGLSVSAHTPSRSCRIVGTPTALSPQTRYMITATNTGGSNWTTITLTVNDDPPTALAYSDPTPTYTVGTRITDNTPTSGGGAVTSYSILPALPAGLSFNSSTGVIAGTPSATQLPAVEHTITATNTGGSTTATVTITVHEQTPTLSYGASSFNLTVGDPASLPATATHASSFAIDGTLPAGLTFDALDGTISGTPSVITPAADVTITATNSTGQTASVILAIAAVDTPPVISYLPDTQNLNVGTFLPAWTPTNLGGTITGCSSSHALPHGLTIDSSCQIVGTPTTISGTEIFTITASNTGGSSATTITLTVNDDPPTALAYFDPSPTYTVGTRITDNTPTSGGGAVTSYSILPALPAGLSFNSSTGAIAGTPSATQLPAVEHTITATNTGGSTTATVTITVHEQTPTLSYGASSFNLTVGDPASLPATATHAASFSLTGTLPAGLAFNTANGTISGTPSVITPAADVTITATNSTGQTASVILAIAAVDDPPSLAYTGSPYSLVINEAAPAITPVNSGGAVTSCTSTPALPDGLSLSATCQITGTPTVLRGLAAYLISATNSGGTDSLYISIEVTSGETPVTVPNIFLNWISHSATDGTWNGTPNTEGRVWRARINGSSLALHSTLTAGWANKDLVQPPRLAPNGAYWVAVSTRNLSGNPSDPDNPCSNLWSVSPDGSTWTALTTRSTAGQDSLDPAISPDSSTIAFASHKPLPSGGGTPNSYNIWTIQSNGTGATALTSETNANRDSREPSFHPTGGGLVFASNKKIGAATSQSYNLWKYDFGTSTATHFSSDTTTDMDRRQPRYSNDGTLLVYVSIQPLTSGGSATDSYNIWVSDASTLDESPLTTVTTIGQDVLHPEFSANDAYIAFDGYRPVSIMTPNSSNIWVYDIARATFTPITQNRNAGLDSWLMPGSTW